MAAAGEPDRQRPDDQRLIRVVFDGVVRVVEEARAFGDPGREGIQPGPAARRQVHRERIGSAIAPRVEVAKADEVEGVVGVHVADHDGRQPVRVHPILERPDHALPGVQHDRRVVPLDQVARGGRLRVGDRRAVSEHGQAQASPMVSHGGHRTACHTPEVARGRRHNCQVGDSAAPRGVLSTGPQRFEEEGGSREGRP